MSAALFGKMMWPKRRSLATWGGDSAPPGHPTVAIQAEGGVGQRPLLDLGFADRPQQPDPLRPRVLAAAR
jgi:hypothetical protein